MVPAVRGTVAPLLPAAAHPGYEPRAVSASPANRSGPLVPLSVPGVRSRPGCPTEAVALFADRARSVKPSFTISPGKHRSGGRDLPPSRRYPARDRVGGRAGRGHDPAEIAANLDTRFRLLRARRRRATVAIGRFGRRSTGRTRSLRTSSRWCSTDSASSRAGSTPPPRSVASSRRRRSRGRARGARRTRRAVDGHGRGFKRRCHPLPPPRDVSPLLPRAPGRKGCNRRHAPPPRGALRRRRRRNGARPSRTRRARVAGTLRADRDNLRAAVPGPRCRSSSRTERTACASSPRWLTSPCRKANPSGCWPKRRSSRRCRAGRHSRRGVCQRGMVRAPARRHRIWRASCASRPFVTDCRRSAHHRRWRISCSR